MLENIFIARHGFRQGFNWPKTPTGIKRDPPLTAFGETQAKELATYFLNNPDIKLDAIFSSPW
ncbi:C6 zinc cluster transcription factor-like protein [Cystobasidiomycetes sp. EMM_F5]